MKVRKQILSLLIFVVSLLPYWLIFCLADIFYFFLYHVFKYRRKIVFNNLLLAFPEKNDYERKTIEVKFYRFLADLILESLKLRTISAKTVKKRFTLKNEKLVHDYLENGQPILGLTAHYGNWELGLHRLSLMTKHPVLVIYKPLSNKVFEDVYYKIRSRFNARLVPMKRTLRAIMKVKDQPHITMFVSDQTPTLQESHYFTSFLGQTTLVFEGIEKVAKKMNFPVVYCHVDRLRRGHYQCTFELLMDKPLEAEPYHLTNLHTQYLEDIIRKKPELWLWSHRRWKHKPHTE